MKRYYSLAVNNAEKEADVYIFGDIVDPTTQEWFGIGADVSGYSLALEVKDLDVDIINVHINSYGGVVSDGLAIYNTLRNHKAKIKTYNDGFACSAASVVFEAGDERIASNASLLLIHNAWMNTAGNSDQLRKDADDLEKITQASVEVYKDCTNLTEEEIKALMKAETWILPDDALAMGFATSITTRAQTNKPSASASTALFNLIKNALTESQPAGNLQPAIPSQADPQPPLVTENKPLNMLNAIFGRKDKE